MSKKTITFLFCFVIALHFSGCSSPEPRPVRKDLVKDLAEPLGVKIDRIAEKHDIPLTLAHALVEEESLKDEYAVSHTGAIGLTQLLRSTARGECNVRKNKELFKPDVNLDCGFKYLKKLKDKHTTWYRALISYNIGAKYVDKPTVKAQRYAMAIIRKAKI